MLWCVTGGVTEANDQTAQTTTQVTPSEPVGVTLSGSTYYTRPMHNSSVQVTTAEPSAEEDTAPSTAAAAAVETQEKIPDETKGDTKSESYSFMSCFCAYIGRRRKGGGYARGGWR